MVDEVGFTHGPRSRITEERRQAALDAAAVLQLRRSEIAACLARGEPCEAEVVARTLAGAQLWIRDEIRAWRELLTVRPSGTLPHLRVSLPYNREVIANGLRMISLWDWDGLKPEARRLLAGERVGRYLFGVGPVQMNIVDRRFVVLQGPFLDGEPTVMAVTAPDCVAAAWQYWHAAVASSYPADEDEAVELEGLTPRQRQIAALLAVDTRDEAIAETLGVSVRTVRADVAQLMAALGVRSRFAAGTRFREMVDDG
ncbi:helix-turn-helix transcriptional regulator [Nocardioides sp.]|uniref:helix-turn-helix transcriptional regulator n=1 Tax=Nocardioides sp. TaxID=35761 RepID=UPI0025CFA4A6|nr:helix-turn-helix transcriptional regulator [Nocardioides sp.]